MRILYLDLDSLRPDHLGCYGYHRDTSPNIDRIARQGVVFEECCCSDSPCLPSRTALMSGRFGIHTGAVGHGGTAGDFRLEGAGRAFRSRLDRESLPGFLRTLRYRTASISPFAERHGAWWFNAGFSEIHNTGGMGMESAEEVSPVVLKWLGENARQDNWFLHVNFWDPHMPSRAPEEFGNPFQDEPLPHWLTEEVWRRITETEGIMRGREKERPYRGYAQGGRPTRSIEPAAMPPYPRNPAAFDTMDDLRMIIDGYDCGVRFMDHHIGLLFEALEEAGVMDETAIIVSADHGENLGELAVFGDHITADYATAHIPLIVKWPGAGAGSREAGLHYNLDLGPTLAELLGGETPEVWDGRSYSPALTDGHECGRDQLVLSPCAGTCQRSVRFDRWHYIRTYHDGYSLFPKEMLFDVAADPHEQHDVAAQHPKVCREAVYRLADWHDRMMDTMPPGYDTDPMRTVIREGGPSHVRGRLDAYLGRLEDRGKGREAEELRSRHPREYTR